MQVPGELTAGGYMVALQDRSCKEHWKLCCALGHDFRTTDQSRMTSLVKT